MKDTIIELKSESRENTVLHFPPNQHLDAIKAAIIKQCIQKKKKREAPNHNDHIGGLPSPPVEDKKVTPEPEEVAMEILPTSNEIREKIKRLTDEKHRLFQMLKQLMLQEEQNKKRQQLQLQQQKQLQQQQQMQQQQMQQQQQQNNIQQQNNNIQQHHQKKKSRWAPISSCDHLSYFYPRPRYQPYSNVSLFYIQTI
ncbi:hypothetical protein EDC94DRAFT_619619 [Helicostylum pulchrum]|nr:hypothetical protein EDC94DRAFT_619619 [Helicostylum pulchrum]